MNKYQKQVQKYTLEQEKEIIDKLKTSYQEAKEEIEKKLAELLGRDDLQSVIYQRKYQEQLKKQIDDILSKMNNVETLEDYLKICYENGYIGAMYDIANQGVPITMPINQKQMVECFTNPNTHYKNIVDIVEHTDDRTSSLVMNAMSRGIASGHSYSQIAKDIDSSINVGYRKAVQIARTEGHRVQQSAQMQSLSRVKEQGADVVKQWDSTLDGKTRETHRLLDGQTVEIDEPFKTVNGDEAMYPSGFGVAEEDCNCRCCMLERARWNLDSSFTKMNNFGVENEDGNVFKVLESFKTSSEYKEFKDTFYSKGNVEYMNFMESKFKKYDTRNLNEVCNAMSESETKEFKTLFDNNPHFKKIERE